MFIIRRSDWRYLAIILYTTYTSYSAFAYSIFGFNPLIRYVLVGFTSIVYAAAFLNMRRSEIIRFAALEIVAILFFLVEIFIFPENEIYISSIMSAYVTTIPFCCLVIGCERKRLYSVLPYIAIVLTLCNCLEPIIRFTLNQERGYMTFGFRYVPAVIIFLIFALETHERKYWIGTAVSLFEVLVWGNRSSLILITTAVALYVVFNTDSRKKIKQLTGIVSVVIITSMVNMTSIVEYMASLLEKLGLNSRTLQMLLDSEYSSDNGRYIVWNRAWQYVKERWVFGYGVGGDRRLVLASWNAEQYVHNIVLEIFIDFGLILGICAIIWVLYLIITRLSKSISREYKNIIIVFVSYSIPKLMVSGSYWSEPFFWIALFILLSQDLRKNDVEC